MGKSIYGRDASSVAMKSNGSQSYAEHIRLRLEEMEDAQNE